MHSIVDFLPTGWPESNLMIAFGVLLAFGTLGGLLAARVRWLPTITGFMACGLVIGPSGIGLLPQSTLDGARALVDLALGVGFVTTRIARQTRRNEQHLRFALLVGAVMLSLGLAVALKVSTLFTALALGIVCRWLQGRSRLTRVEFGGGGDVFFIILFVVAGANLHLSDLVEHAPAALGFVLMRCLAKAVAVYACGRAFGFAHRRSTAVSLMLLPMAGLAIGLVQSTAGLAPELGAQVGAVVLAAVAVFETFGPPLVAYALRLSGEARPVDDPPQARPSAADGSAHR